MSLQKTTGGSPQIGVPGEALREARQQTEFEEASRRYSNLAPRVGRYEQESFLRKVSRRPWPGRVILALWIVGGVPLGAILVASITAARGSAVERVIGAILACLIWGTPLSVLVTMTQNWLARHRRPGR